MNKYSEGKIYKIVDNTNGNIYIGSTIESLKKRLIKHKSAAYKDDRSMTSEYIIKNGDYDIILIENYPCESKLQLEVRERYFIENNECINKYIPGRTKKEWCEDNIEYLRKYDKDRNEIRYKWMSSMGGRPSYNNMSLLKIDPFLFN